MQLLLEGSSNCCSQPVFLTITIDLNILLSVAYHGKLKS